MNEQFTPELLAKARTAESPEALLALAAEGGVTLTPEEAQAYFDQLHQTGELSDEELDNVAGGAKGKTTYRMVAANNFCHAYQCRCGFTSVYTTHVCRECNGKEVECNCYTCKYMEERFIHAYPGDYLRCLCETDCEILTRDNDWYKGWGSNFTPDSGYGFY